MSSIYHYTRTLYQLLRNQLTNSVPTVSQGEDAECGTDEVTLNPFDTLPVEMFDLILDHLDVTALNQCRLVSKHWTELISRNRRFFNNICFCCVESGQTDSSRSELEAYFQPNGTSRPRLRLDALRLRHLYAFWNELHPSLCRWLNASHLSNVRWLELSSSQLKISQLLQIVAEFESLKTLRITGDTIVHYCGLDVVADPVLVRCRFQLRHLEHLEIHFEDVHNFLITLDRLDLLVFQNLITLDVQGDAGNTTNIFRIGAVLEKLWRQNSDSLRILRLDNFPARVRGSLDTNLSSSKYELRSSLYAEFPQFCAAVAWNHLPVLPLLEELSLRRFPVAPVSVSWVTQDFPAILSKLGRNLKKFRISTLYLDTDLKFEQVAAILPTYVTLEVDSVHLYAPVPNLDNIRDVVHCEQNILKYRLATVELSGGKFNWTIFYLTWSSLKNPVMVKWAGQLSVLKLTSALFPVGDTELQVVLGECPKLEELSFDSCDLSKLTDSGITGLSPGAVNKWWTDERYEPTDTDYWTIPIQNLTKLRLLKMADVGPDLTHVSLQALKKLKRLEKVVIHQQAELTIRTSAVTEFRNHRNILLEYQVSNLA